MVEAQWQREPLPVAGHSLRHQRQLVSARPKHRHDDSPDEQLRVHPNFLREARLDAARDSEMDEYVTSPEEHESYDEYEQETGRGKRKAPTHTSEESSQDDPTPDKSIDAEKLAKASTDSETGPEDAAGAAAAPSKAKKPPAKKRKTLAPTGRKGRKKNK